MAAIGRRGWRELGPALGLVLASVLAGITPIADGDVFWHLAAGREMLARHALLRSDPFSVSAYGRPWVDVHWLFQLGLYGLHQAGGLSMLVAAKCALVAAGALLLYASVDRVARPLFALILGSALIAARHLLLVRPVIVTLVLLAFAWLVLERHRRTGATRALMLLPAAELLWANCQGLFALGPVLVLAFAASALGEAAFAQRRWFARVFVRGHASGTSAARALLLTLALMLIASLCTPYGFAALRLSASLFERLLPHAGNVYLEVAENVPPFQLERVEPGAFWHVKWYFAGLGVLFWLSQRRVVLAHAFVLAAFGALALMSNRNVLLFYWLASPIVAIQIAPQLRLLLGRRAGVRRLAAGAFAVSLVALLGIAGLAAAREPSLRAPTPFRFPEQSARRLAEMPGAGPIFSADAQGGYLIWTLYPRFRPYMDTRLVLRSPDEFQEFISTCVYPDRFAALERRHHFAYAILPTAYPDRYLPLIAYLYRSAEWTLVYTDGSEALFARREFAPSSPVDLSAHATTERILGELRERYPASPRLFEAARFSLVSLELAVGAHEQAERVLRSIDSPEARGLRARARLLAGDDRGAERLLAQLQRERPDDVKTWTLRAAIALRQGEPRRASQYLRRAVEIDPFDAEAQSLQHTVEQSHEP